MNKMEFNLKKSIRTNVKTYLKTNNLTEDELALPLGLSGKTLLQYCSNNFKNANGSQHAKHKLSEQLVKSLFTTDIYHKEKYENLYDTFNCDECKYRSKIEKGCIKFSLSKSEINNNYFVNTLNMGSFKLSISKPCPYAKGVHNED